MDLYQAILHRRSVRRYQTEPLSKEALAQVDDIIAHVTPLAPETHFHVMCRDVVTGEDLVAAMGGYGRILSPPHYMVPYATGPSPLLIELGYRMEQIVVQMVQLGISSCFIGSLDREQNVRVRFRLRREARIGAFLIYGHPTANVAGRAINAVIRRTQRADAKLPAEEIFYHGDFTAPSSPPKSLSRLLEAARHAPSAKNAQPWRFLWQGEQLYLFLQRQNPRYGSQDVLQEYRYFDGGTCMANVMLAMEALDILGHWELLERDSQVPAHPAELEPLARLMLD